VYMGEAFPVTEDLKFFEGCSKLNAINEVILEQLSKLSKENLGKLQPILDRSDEVIHAIGQIIPELQVYTQWLKAERARVEPGSIEYICEETLRMHQALKALIRPYCMDEEHSQEGDAGGKI